MMRVLFVIYPAILIALVLQSVCCERFAFTTTVDKQVTVLKNLGFDLHKLDHSTQLRVFLYTWLAMERGEMGKCGPELKNGVAVGKRNDIERRSTWAMDCPGRGANQFVHGVDSGWCCEGWITVMGICTRSGWYNGPESASLKKTFKTIQDTMWACGSDIAPYPALP